MDDNGDGVDSPDELTAFFRKEWGAYESAFEGVNQLQSGISGRHHPHPPTRPFSEAGAQRC